MTTETTTETCPECGRGDDCACEVGVWPPPRRPETSWERAVRLLDGGDHAVAHLGQFGERYTARPHLRRMSEDQIDVVFHGSRVAQIHPHRVVLWACGYGHSPATRAVLSWALGGDDRGVYSHRRQLRAYGELFREGITFSHDGRMVDPGYGKPVEGAPPRRRRDEFGGLR